jgi:hypothetical protein
MKRSRAFLLLLVLTMLVLTTLLLLPALVSGQDEPVWPTEYEEEQGEEYPAGTGFSCTGATPSPGAGTAASVVTAHMQDTRGIAKDEFIGSESFYLVVQVNQPGRLYIVEYYPAGAIPSWHWLMRGARLTSGGTWTIGPFTPESREPEGEHAWTMRFYAPWASYDEKVIRWDYYRQEVVTPQDISTSVVTSSSATSLKVGDMVSVFGTLSPMVAGTITIEQSADAVTWLPIGSGPATSTVAAQFKPDKPGTYFIRAKYNGYLDTTANKNYLPSQSTPISLQVTAKKTWVIPLAVGLGIVVAGAIGFFVWRRLAKKPIKAE